MSTPVRTGLTRADLDDLPDDGRRRELVDGRLLVSPLARRRHQAVVARITYRLMRWTEQHGGTVYPGVNVDLADDTHLEPDVAYAHSQDTSGQGFVVPPELVVEVSSPSARSFDLGEKKDRYAADGCAELWFVDLDADTVVQLVLEDGGSYGRRVHRRGDRLTPSVLPDLDLEVDELLGPAEC